MLRFLGALGIEFMPKNVSKGGQCHHGFCGSVEITIYSLATARERAPNFQLSFQVAGLDQLFEKLCAIDGVISVLDPTLLPDGKKAIVIDPDGRAVELTEKA